MFVDVSLEFTGECPEKPIEEKPVYKTLWYFSQMTPEKIRDLGEQELGRALSLLETEDQDDLVRRLPENLEKGFWDLIKQYDLMDERDEVGNQTAKID